MTMDSLLHEINPFIDSLAVISRSRIKFLLTNFKDPLSNQVTKDLLLCL